MDPSIFHHLSETDYDSLFFRAQDKTPIPFQTLFPPQPTALVHHSLSLLQNPQGKEIDQFSTILRILPFRISSYEDFTGTKTSLWITENITEEKQVWDRNNGFFLPLFITGHFLPFEKKQSLLKTQYGDNILSQSIIFHCDTFLKFFRMTTHIIPSGSLLLLLILATRYKQVHIFGFDLSTTLTYFFVPVPRSPYFEKENQILHYLSHRKIIHQRLKADQTG